MALILAGSLLCLPEARKLLMSVSAATDLTLVVDVVVVVAAAVVVLEFLYLKWKK